MYQLFRDGNKRIGTYETLSLARAAVKRNVCDSVTEWDQTDMAVHADDVTNCEALENWTEKQGYYVPEYLVQLRRVLSFQIHLNSSIILSFDGT